MIKILHLVGVMNRAGMETFIMNMYRNIDSDEYRFDFLCTLSQTGEYDEEIIERGGRIYYLPLKTSGGMKRHIDNYRTMIEGFKRYADEYDVLHIHNYHAFDSYLSALPAVKSGFKKVIVHSHSTSAEFHPILHKMARLFLCRLPIIKLACSQAAGAWLFGRDDIEVISNGIDLDLYKYDFHIRENYRKELGINEAFVLGHVGRFDYVKNQKFLCDLVRDSAKKISNIVVVMVGDGCERRTIEDYAEQLGIKNKILFLGTRTDVNKLYQAFDVFVFPSIFEGIPLAVIEAETSGLPCVLSEGVPKDVDYSDSVFHERLDNMGAWIDRIYQIIDMKIDRYKGQNTIKQAGYDVKESCRKLQRVYSM